MKVHTGTASIEWSTPPYVDKPTSFIDRLLVLSDRYETEGSHGPASLLRRELVIELRDQLAKIDEARATLTSERVTPEIKEQVG